MTVTLIFQYDFIFLIVAQRFVFSALKKRTEGLIFWGQSQAIVPWRFSFTPVSFCLFVRWLKAHIFPDRFYVFSTSGCFLAIITSVCWNAISFQSSGKHGALWSLGHDRGLSFLCFNYVNISWRRPVGRLQFVCIAGVVLVFLPIKMQTFTVIVSVHVFRREHLPWNLQTGAAVINFMLIFKTAFSRSKCHVTVPIFVMHYSEYLFEWRQVTKMRHAGCKI